jgi:hypothetical protein
MCGGLAGLSLAFWGAGPLSTLIRVELPAWVKVGVDFRVLAFTFIVSAIAGTLTF